jgi:hypothetical protein
MTLQASGAISLMQVNQELGRGAFSTISLNVFNTGGVDVVQTGTGNVTINQCSPSRPNGTAPTSMSEWYNYDHNASCGEVPATPSIEWVYRSQENSGVLFKVVGTNVTDTNVTAQFRAAGTNNTWNNIEIASGVVDSGADFRIFIGSFSTTIPLSTPIEVRVRVTVNGIQSEWSLAKTESP